MIRAEERAQELGLESDGEPSINTGNWTSTLRGAYNSRPLLIKLLFAKHIANNMVFPSDVSVMQKAPATSRRWQPDGPEGQQLKNDVASSFLDGSLDVANPDFMALYRKAPAMYGQVY